MTVSVIDLTAYNIYVHRHGDGEGGLERERE